MVELYTGRWDLVVISIVLFAAFLILLPYRRRIDWNSHGIYTSFIIALFAEMFGFPLTIFLASSYFNWLSFRDEFLTYMNYLGMPIGLAIMFVGVLLVILGWKMIHKGRGQLVISGIYAYIRHPQYLGLILVTGGWLIHWPTIPTAIMWPILLFAYYRLAIKEEKSLVEQFGEAYVHYMSRVPRLIPLKRGGAGHPQL